MNKTMARLLTASAALAFTAGSVHASTIIYEDDFSGSGAADLDGTTPDTTTGGETWVANTNFKADGSLGSSSSSATLAFTPVDGLVYTLEGSLGTLTGGGQWVAVGFANGQPDASGTDTRFISNNNAPATDNVIGLAWIFGRGDASVNANRAFLGSDPTVTGGSVGTADGADWTSSGNISGGNLDLRIVLDTTGGAGTWTVTWLVDTTPDTDAVDDFVVVRATTSLLSEDIDSVGFATSGGLTSGQISSFSLTSVPEPGSLALLAAGGFCVLRRRRS